MKDFNLTQSLLTLRDRHSNHLNLLLMWYIKTGGKNLKGVDAIVEKGASPHIIEPDSHGLLSYARTWKMAKHLIDIHKIDVHMHCRDERMAQHWQAYACRAAICAGLIRSGADVWKKDALGLTMLDYANRVDPSMGIEREETIRCITKLQKRPPAHPDHAQAARQQPVIIEAHFREMPFGHPNKPGDLSREFLTALDRA